MTGGGGRHLRGTPPPLIYLCLGLFLLLPELAAGLIWTDSGRFNLVWLPGFTDAMQRGAIYPRWLPDTFGGLGSSTFYFYPPLYFWLAGLIRLASGNWLGALSAGSLASAALFGFSGWSMRAWLLPIVGRHRAFWAGIAYVLAPFHLNEVYWRGAVAEAAVYPILPLLLLGIDRFSSGRRSGVLVLAPAYAALILAHLPLALLASVTLIPAYALYRAIESGRPLGILLRLAASLALGWGCTAVYLAPALAFPSASSQSALQGQFFTPSLWFFYRWNSWPSVSRMVSIILLSGGMVAMGVSHAWRNWRILTPDARFWALALIVLFALVAGGIPFFWSLPEIDRVQFPWRLLPIMELATVAMIACAGHARLGRWPAVVAGALLLGGAAAFIVHCWAPMGRALTGKALPSYYAARLHGDAPEYLPDGYPIPRNSKGYGDPDAIKLPLSKPIVESAAGNARVLAQFADGGMRVMVDAPASTMVVARRFFFPTWRAVSDHGVIAPTHASGPFRLLTWQVPAGRTVWTLEIAQSEVEKRAGWVSLLSMLMLFAYAAASSCLFSRASAEAQLE